MLLIYLTLICYISSYTIFTYSSLQTYYILDEILIAGELQESSKKIVHRLIDAQVLWDDNFDPFYVNVLSDFV